MSFVRRHLALLALVLLWAAGCADADPMPSPGMPARNRILVSATLAQRQGGPVSLVGVVGLPGAVPGAGWVELRQPFGDLRTVARASAEGTFATVVSGAAGDQLTLVFRETLDGPESDAVDLSVGHYDKDAAPSTPQTGPGLVDTSGGVITVTAPRVSPPDGHARIQVQGTNLTPGEVAAIGNVRTGAVVEVQVSETGTIEAALEAATGDTIVAILRNPQTGATSQIASLSVPAP